MNNLAVEKELCINVTVCAGRLVQSGAFEHSVLHVQEIYALENVVLYIAVYGPYKP